LFADEITPDIQRALNGLAANISAAAYNMGKQYAESKLDTTRDQYVSNLKLDKLSPSTYLISLDPSVNHLEDGYDAFDMKPGLLNGPKARYTKGGVKFNIIPFRIGAKEAAPVLKYGSAVAPRDFTQTWKKDFGGALNAKKAGISGIQRGADGTPLQGVVGRVGRNKNVPPNLQGMNKIQKTYGKTTQSQYMTFRTVSSKSKPSSWQHPGFKGIQAFQEIERFADAEINRFVSSLKF